MDKKEFYKYGESLGIKINDLQRLAMLLQPSTPSLPSNEAVKSFLISKNPFWENFPEDAAHVSIHTVTIWMRDLWLQSISPQKESEWVSIEERLPEIDDSVLVAIKHRNGIKIEHDWYDREFKRWAKLRFNDIITHWMPLPTPPQQKEQ